MAAKSALPTNALDSDGSCSEHHDHRHRHHSNGWKPITQRSPLRPASSNGRPPPSNPLKPQNYAYAAPPKFSDSLPLKGQDLSESNHPLLLPNLPLAISNGRPNSMEQRRSSVSLPTHLRLGSSGYGFPLAKAHRYMSSPDGAARKWITTSEVLSSVLVPLPYILASLACGTYKIHQFFLQPSVPSPVRKTTNIDSTNRDIRFTAADGSLMSVCALTSIILLLVGFKGKIFGAPKVLRRRRPTLGNRGTAASQPVEGIMQRSRRILARALSVALPFYATLKLSGDRVALVMLVSLAANIVHSEDEITKLRTIKGWKRLWTHRLWTLASISFQIVYDFVWSSGHSIWETCLGYLLLIISVLFIPPPFPLQKSRNSSTSRSASPVSKLFSTQWESRTAAKAVPEPSFTISPLVATTRDVDLTLVAGVIVGALSCSTFFFSGRYSYPLSFIDLGFGCLSACTAALSFLFIKPHSIRQNRGFGLLIGALSSAGLMAFLQGDQWTSIIFRGFFACLSFAATTLDMNVLTPTSLQSEHHHESHLHTTHRGYSRLSGILIRAFQNWPLTHSILAEKDSRRIFYFMVLNFAFMLVQTFYGIASGSLGLLSDSIHMFFDCIALVVGLCAAVMSKWPPSTRFPYGYGKMDTLAGFANGIFLMLISVEIVYEAVERLVEGSQMNRIGELLIVSSLGLIVNIIGMTAFGHAHHGHSHGGHDHSSHNHSHDSHSGHSHSNHDKSHASHACHDQHSHIHASQHFHADHTHPAHSDPNSTNHDHDTQNIHRDHHDENHGHTNSHEHAHAHPTPPSITPASSQPSHSHSHSHKYHHHHHHHGNENMHGIYLHILADTLGSVAVVISTLLIHFYGWSGFDPLASCLIAILIFASAIPLVVSSAKTLLLTMPEDIEFDLRQALAGINVLRGVSGYTVPKFWLEEGGGEEGSSSGNGKKVLGVIHVIASKGADLEDVKERAVALFEGKNMHILVQVERVDDGRCWCGGMAKVSATNNGGAGE